MPELPLLLTLLLPRGTLVEIAAAAAALLATAGARVVTPTTTVAGAQVVTQAATAKLEVQVLLALPTTQSDTQVPAAAAVADRGTKALMAALAMAVVA